MWLARCSAMLFIWALWLAAAPGVRAAGEFETEAADTVVATVNGEEISARLFHRRLIGKSSSAYSYFRERYGVSDSADFWTTRHDGVTPLEWLKKHTLDECVRIVIEQTLARQKGVIADISYSAFLQSLDRENERRRKALAAGEPIYGPQQYREDDYFDYVFTNMVIELKRRLGADELNASEETLRQWYELRKHELYSRDDSVVAQVIAIPYGRRDDLSREAARARIEEAELKIKGGALFEEVANEYSENQSGLERKFDEESGHADDRQRSLMRAMAMKLAPGEISPVFEEAMTFYLLKCIERESLGYRPFEEMVQGVRHDYVNEKYEEHIANLLTKASIEINRPVYDAIQPR